MSDWKQLIRLSDRKRLIQQAREQEPVKGTPREISHNWAVRLYLPCTNCLWIITEITDEAEGIAFGLGQIQVAELGSVWLPELFELDVHGLKVKQDLRFDGGGKTLREWSAEASRHGGMLPPVI